MVGEDDLQCPNGVRQIVPQRRHAIFKLRKKRFGSLCLARMKLEIRRAAENMKAGLEILTDDLLTFIVRHVRASRIGKQHRKRIVTESMVLEKVSGLRG